MRIPYNKLYVVSKGKFRKSKNCHPELVSGSIVPNFPDSADERWMLKQVQHDRKAFT